MDTDQHWFFFNTSYGVTGYLWLLPGTAQVPQYLWRTNILGDGIRFPSDVEVVADATVSQSGSYVSVQGGLLDRTSHLDSKSPAGGNIVFEDSHAEWRKHSQMHTRFGNPAFEF
jgi:hypothetical protein